MAVGYRLAPEHPFPAARDDALTAWRRLRSEGYAAKHIAVGGDSAGGNLTLALVGELKRAGEDLPGALWLLSPWIDLTMSGATLVSKSAVDPLIQKGYLEELTTAFAPANMDRKDPRLSPLYADLKGLPPTLIQIGSAETLLDDAVRLVAAAGAADVSTTLEIWPHMIHAWPPGTHGSNPAVARSRMRAHSSPEPISVVRLTPPPAKAVQCGHANPGNRTASGYRGG